MSENKAKKLPQYIAAVSICIGALGTGTVIGWSANITQDLKEGKLNDFTMDDDELGWAGSSMTLGAMVMCFPIGWIADAIGRKLTVLLTVIPFVIGWLLIIFSQHIAMIYAGRFLTGVAGGSFCVTAPLYTSEISETEIRGRLGSLHHLFLTIGILYSYIFGYAVSMMVFHYVLLPVPIIFAISFIFMPETPIHLIRKGQVKKVPKVFKFLRGEKYDFSSEMATIEELVAEEANAAGFWETMSTKASKKAVAICMMLIFLQQFSGIFAAVFYLDRIFIAAKAGLAAHWCVVIIGCVEVLVSLCSNDLMNKVGSKILLILSCGGMSLSCFLLGLYFTLKDKKYIDKEILEILNFIPIIAFVLFMVGYYIGIGPVPWLAPAELFAPEVRTVCSSVAASFNWLLAFIITRFYLNVVNAIGNDLTFYSFATIMAFGSGICNFFFPDIKGKSFSQIRAELEGTPEE